MRSARRPAFTLLEVILAMAIAVLLLGGLYVVLSVQLHQMRSGREITEQNALVRVLLTRISNDVANHLGPVDPRIGNAKAIEEAAAGIATTAPTSSESGSNTTDGTTPSNSSDGTGSANSGTDTTSKTSSTETESTENQATGGCAFFNLGIQGDATHLFLYVSQVKDTGLGTELGPISDLRRVAWWMAGTPDAPLGLARHEVRNPTSAEGLATQVPTDATPYIVSDQVTNLMFEYFDGQIWQPAWDGMALMADGKTPMGPPAAVAVTLTISTLGAGGGPPRHTTLRQVVFIPSANGADMGMGGLTP